jgi:hypothetical protein
MGRISIGDRPGWTGDRGGCGVGARGVGAAAATAAAVTLTAAVCMVDPASAAVSDRDGAGRDSRYRERTCERAMDESPTGELEKTMDPAPGSAVSPGQIVGVALRWDPAGRPDGDLHKVIDCMTVDGVLDADLSVEERPTDNDGIFEIQLVVPDLPAGTELCNFGFLSEDEAGHGYVRSETLCLTVGDQQAAAVPAPPAEVAGGNEVAGETQTAPAPAPARASAPGPAPARASAPAPAPGSMPQVMGEVLSVPELPRTGPADDLRLLAGSLLALGGLGIAVSAKRHR